MRRSMKILLFVAGLVVVLLAVLMLALANPLNSFMERSDHFSDEAFEAVEVGSNISSAIRTLGKPIRVAPLGDDYWLCPKCIAYCFVCNPPDWLIGYKEAWIYVGPDGIVKRKLYNTQP